jgi:hypothetical protein
VNPARAAAAAVLLTIAGCGAGGIESQDRPHVVAVFPADSQAIPGWLDKVRITYDEPVRVLNPKSVRVASTAEDMIATIVSDPTDPRSVLVVTYGGRWFPGLAHRVAIQEGAVANASDHYASDQLVTTFTVGAGPHAFLSSTDGRVYEVVPVAAAQVAVTDPPAGYAAGEVLGAAEEVFVWLRNTGAGDDELGWFAPGAGAVTPIATAGETGDREGLGLALSADGRTLYATAFDAATGRVHVHRVDVATRTEVGASLPLSTATPASLRLAKRPAVDLARNRLYVAQDDGAGAGFFSVVDLATFIEMDVAAGPTLAVPVADGAGDLTYGLERDRIWMTLADEATAGFAVFAPGGYVHAASREPTFTQGPASSFLTPTEFFFVQGLASYSNLEGVVRAETADIGEGFASPVNDDVGGVLQGSDTIAAFVYDPATTFAYAFAVGSGRTVLVAYEVVFDAVAQVDLDSVTDGVQGVDLALAAPGEVVSATFLRGARAP